VAALRFTTTRLGGLAAAGRVDELQHAVVAPFLERELGARHGRLFADFEAEGSDMRAWYADAAAPPRRATDLSPADAGAVRAAAAALLADVAALAERLSAAGPQRAALARALAAATTFPEEDLWCDGDQPIIVNWGFHRREVPAGTPQAILEAGRPKAAALAPAGSTTAPPPLILTPARPARGPIVVGAWRAGWPAVAGLWLLFALLVLACYRLLLPACGLAGSFGGLGACPAMAGERDAAAEGAGLQAEVRAAELQLAQAQRVCAAPGRAAALDPQVEGRLPADAPRGAVEVSLLWEGHADLDLVVDCPGGGRLWQGSPGLQSCGGRLLHDVNKAGEPLLDHPIEHAAWDAPSPGPYKVEVELYGYNDVPPGTEVPFTVRVRRGAETKAFEGRVKGERTTVTAASVDF